MPDSWSKGPRFKFLQEQREKFLLLSHLSVLLFRYLFQLRVTAVACKRSQSFFPKCRWQVAAKHRCTLPMWFWMKWHWTLVHSCMVYTELALRRQQFHVAPAMQQPNSTVSTPLPLVLKPPRNGTIKATATHSESHATWTEWVCPRAENSAIQKLWIITKVLTVVLHLAN